MARPASELSINPFLRELLLGPAKLGKTSTAVATSPPPVRVILCEDDSALEPALRMTKNFTISNARTPGKGAFKEMMDVLLEAKNDAKAGKIKTLVVDPFSDFAHHVMEESLLNTQTSSGNDDGRKAFFEIGRRIDHALDFILSIPCHVIVVSHYTQQSAEIDGQLKKSGEGVVPMIPGQMRNRMAGKFRNVLWFDVDPKNPNERVIVTGPRGAFGPGCRSLTGTHLLPADFTALIKTFAENAPKTSLAPRTAPPTTTARPPLRPVNGGRR